jgi:tetratricopeptide (TPR) repeat protein
VPVQLDESYGAIYERATVAMARGDTDQAVQLLWRIINRLAKLRPATLQRREVLENTLRSAWNALTQVLRRQKRYEEAIQACHAVADHLSGTRAPERMVASLRIEQGEVEEGLEQLRQIAGETSTLAAWTDLGSEYMALDRYREAEACYKTARQLAESNETAAFVNIALFRTYQAMGRLDDALSTWGMATVLDPDLAVHVSEVYSWLIEREELERAERYLQREGNSARRMLYQGLIEWKSGHGAEARSLWQRVVQLDPQHEDVDEVAWMEAALRLNEPERVLTFEEKAFGDLTLVSEGQGTLVGIAYAAAGKLESARHWLDQIQRELQRAWPPAGKIETRYRALLEQVVSDKDTVQALRSYFEED